MKPITQSSETTLDPHQLVDRSDVRSTTEQNIHENMDHCNVDVAGRVVVSVRNEDGEHLLPVHDELEIALLPNDTVDADEEWTTKAVESVHGLTGIAVDLDGVLAVRRVDHLLADESEPHARTHRIVFSATPTGGEIQDCKQSQDAGSDCWRAGWFEALPDGITPPPEAGPQNDLDLVFDET
jgi:hypothetical protein